MIVRRSAELSPFSADESLSIVNLVTGADTSQASVVTGRLDGTHAARVNHRSVKIYLVLDGELTVVVDGERAVLGPNDVAAVLPGEVHELHGSGTTFAIVCGPAYDHRDEQMR